MSGTIDWRVAETSSADLHLDISGNYYSKQYFDALNTERIAQSGYALANARAPSTSANPAVLRQRLDQEHHGSRNI